MDLDNTVYKNKYLKYKNKYLDAKKQQGGMKYLNRFVPEILKTKKIRNNR